MLIREANPGDGAELLRLQEQCPQGTTLIVSTVNTPDFFARSNVYENSKIYVACEQERIIGSAACAVRNAVVNDKIEKVGYEFQAFVDPRYRGKRIAGQIHQIREEYLRKQGAVLSYCLIIEGNTPSIRYIERQGFRRHRTIVMPSILVFKDVHVRSKANVRSALAADLTALASLLNRTWTGCQLYEPATAESLGRLFTGTTACSLDSVLVLEDRGEIAACLGLWDWSQVMRITVKALSAKMRIMNVVIDVIRIVRPLPRGPRPGDVLKQAVITPVGFKYPEHLSSLLPHINNLALKKGIQQMFFLAEKSHPLFSVLKGFIHIDTSMHLYVKPLSDKQLPTNTPVYVSGLDM